MTQRIVSIGSFSFQIQFVSKLNYFKLISGTECQPQQNALLSLLNTLYLIWRINLDDNIYWEKSQLDTHFEVVPPHTKTKLLKIYPKSICFIKAVTRLLISINSLFYFSLNFNFAYTLLKYFQRKTQLKSWFSKDLLIFWLLIHNNLNESGFH